MKTIEQVKTPPLRQVSFKIPEVMTPLEQTMLHVIIRLRAELLQLRAAVYEND